MLVLVSMTGGSSSRPGSASRPRDMSTCATGSISVGSSRKSENSGASGRRARRLRLSRISCQDNGLGHDVGGCDGGRGRTVVRLRILWRSNRHASAQGDTSPRASCPVDAGAVAHVIRSRRVASLAWDDCRMSRRGGKHRR